MIEQFLYLPKPKNYKKMYVAYKENDLTSQIHIAIKKSQEGPIPQCDDQFQIKESENDDDDCATYSNDDIDFDNISRSKRRRYDTDPTLEFLNSDNDVTMDAYVLREIRQPMDTSAPTGVPKTSKAKLVPLLVARVRTSLGLPKPTDCTVLLDSGASGSLVSKKITKKLRILKESKCIWNTAAGPMETNQKCKLQFMFPELSETKLIEWKMHIVDSESMNYDIIIG